MAAQPPRTYRVVRVSTNTGRVLKVLATGQTRAQADLYAQGFGPDPSPRTTVRVQPERSAS